MAVGCDAGGEVGCGRGVEVGGTTIGVFVGGTTTGVLVGGTGVAVAGAAVGPGVDSTGRVAVGIMGVAVAPLGVTGVGMGAGVEVAWPCVGIGIGVASTTCAGLRDSSSADTGRLFAMHSAASIAVKPSAMLLRLLYFRPERNCETLARKDIALKLI